MAARSEFKFSFARPEVQSTNSRDADSPLKILVLGNFSGHGFAPDLLARSPLGQRPAVRIDIDRFDDVMARIAPRVKFGDDANGLSVEVLEFRELDDFRPEQIGRNLKSFCRLWEIRQKLGSPATFAQAVSELKQGLFAQTSIPESPLNLASLVPDTPIENDAALLERLLEQRPEELMTTSERSSGRLPFVLDQLIRQAVEPHLIRQADPNQAVYSAAVDDALSDLLHGVLHSSAFQTLEATWRSLRRLVKSIEDDNAIQIFILDVTREELLAELPADDQQLCDWSLFRRLLNDSGPGEDPWSVLIGDVCITASTEDLSLLAALAAAAEQLQIPLIAAADSGLLGCRSLVESPDPADWSALEAEAARYWQTLRRSSAARWIGLVLPRVLLRRPYGRLTDEVETFAFEEFSKGRKHEDYLWGNPAYLCAELIAQAFAKQAWSLELGSPCDVDNLPIHTYSEDGEVKLQPCAELAFGERTAYQILQSGLMPLISWKNRDAVRLLRFQSIADPLSPLAGPWS